MDLCSGLICDSESYLKLKAYMTVEPNLYFPGHFILRTVTNEPWPWHAARWYFDHNPTALEVTLMHRSFLDELKK